MQTSAMPVSDIETRYSTLVASWVQVLYRAVIHRGYDADAMFTRLGIDLVGLYKGETRLPSKKIKFAWEEAARMTGDSAFGLSAAEVAFPTMFHSLSIVMSSCSSLGEAFEKFMRFRHVIDTISINSFEDCGDNVSFGWSPVTDIESEIGAEAFIACLMTLCRWGHGLSFSPHKVFLTRDKPEDTEQYEAFFKAPVEFNCDQNILYFDKESMYRPILTANKELASQSEVLTADYLARTLQGDTIAKVYKVLMDFIANKFCSIELVAEELNMSPRTLQRKLHTLDTSYEALVDDARRDYAIALISDNRVPLKEVSYRAGFSDASNFGRAFKRWTNLSPGQYRQHKFQIMPKI
jgi:AraC-like DNA-binding protein